MYVTVVGLEMFVFVPMSLYIFYYITELMFVMFTENPT